MFYQIYNASLIEALWEKIVPDGYVLMEGGRHPTKLIRLKDDIVGLAFQFPKNVRLGEISSLGFSVELKDEGDSKELTKIQVQTRASFPHWQQIYWGFLLIRKKKMPGIDSSH
mgnify:CR=1 FL=1